MSTRVVSRSYRSPVRSRTSSQLPLRDSLTYPGSRNVYDAIQSTSPSEDIDNIEIGSLVTNEEAIQANQDSLSIARTPEAMAKSLEYRNKQHEIELKYIREEKPCSIGIIEDLRDRLGSLKPQEFKALLQNNFYDASVMRAAMCVTEAIIYTPPVDLGGISSNIRIKHFIRNLKRIGAESVQGFALRGDLENAKSTFIVKAPRDPEDPMLTHEGFVTTRGTNFMRKYLPNFAFVFGLFSCSIPIIDEKTKNVMTWCNSKQHPVDYVIYENIAPGVTFREWVKKECSFEKWLNYYLQILYAVQFAADEIDFTHFDLHDENVILREISGANNNFAIPYKTETGQTEYLKTDLVATIIDFGLSHIKYKGQDFGVYDRLAWTVLPTRAFPLHDAYKLLLMSMRTMYTSGKMDCFNKAAIILKFFDDAENPVNIVQTQAKTYYYLPFNEKTANLNIYDLTTYIREQFDTSDIISPRRPSEVRIIGCQGTDLCMTSKETLDILGTTMNPQVDTAFEFYDLVSRLQAEGREEEVQDIIERTRPRYQEIIRSGNRNYNDALERLTEEKTSLTTYTIVNQPLDQWLNSSATRIYRDYISRVAAISDTLDELRITADSLIYIADVYNDQETIDNVRRAYDDLLRDFEGQWNNILITINSDLAYLDRLRRDPNLTNYINQTLIREPETIWWWDNFPQVVSAIFS